MTDIRTVWHADLLAGDWLIEPPALADDHDLETSVLISLFTDRRAEPDDPLPGAPDERRGWWGDTRAPPRDPIGSRLWLLWREKQTNETRLRAEEYAREALDWMIEDAVADRIEVAALFPRLNWLVLQIDIYRNASLIFSGRYGPYWAEEAGRSQGQH